MTEQEFKETLRGFQAKAKYLCGRGADGRPLNVSVPEYLGKVITDQENPALEVPRSEFMKRSAVPNSAERMQLCALRVIALTNYLMSAQNFLPMFFNTTVLQDNETPWFTNTTTQETKVYYISEDARGPNEVKVVRPQSQTRVDLRILTTKEVKYKARDIYQGSIVDVAVQTLRLAFDLANQMDLEAFRLLTTNATAGGAFGPFVNTDANLADRDFVPNSRVVVTNLPTTNDIDVSGVTSNLLDYVIFSTIQQYSFQWQGSLDEGALIPTGRILVPPLDPKELSTNIAPDGTTANAIAEDLMRNGWAVVGPYHGRVWTFVPDNTLSSGAVYVEFNRKPGHAFLKPSMDMDVVKGINDSIERAEKNEESRYSQKVFGAFIARQERRNVLRIRYKAAYDPNSPGSNITVVG